MTIPHIDGRVHHRQPNDLAIVLTGGGARAAYQVGFLRWVAEHIPHVHFPIITGVSAGAINAAFLAAFPGSHADAIRQLADLWSNLTVEQVFRADVRSLVSHFTRWSVKLVAGGVHMAPRVRGFVDTAPLRETLRATYSVTDKEIVGIAKNLEARRLCALAIITSNYSTGQSVAWVQGPPLYAWERPDRRSRQACITVDHVMASAALPIFFPAIQLDGGWYGDGGIRLTFPCSAAIHLGATRVLAISTRYNRSIEEADQPVIDGYPPPLQISGMLLNAVFLDDLARDAQNLERVNMLLRDLPPEKWRGLRPVDSLVIRPSQDLSRLVAKFEPQLPKFFRHLIRGLGSRETSTPDVLSLLTFEPAYLRNLIELGEADAAEHAHEIEALLRGPVPIVA